LKQHLGHLGAKSHLVSIAPFATLVLYKLLLHCGAFPMIRTPIVPFHGTPQRELVTHSRTWVPRNVKLRPYTLELKRTTIALNKMAFKVDTL
jgi:hypothetical protein